MSDHKGLARAFYRQFGVQIHARAGKKGEVVFSPTKVTEADFYPGSVRSNWLKKNAPRFGLRASGANLNPPNAGLYSAIPTKEEAPPPPDDAT